MTRYISEPIEPFHVPAKIVKCSTFNGETPNGEISGGSGSARPHPDRTPSPLDELQSTSGRIAAGALLAAACFLVYTRPMFTAVAVLVLLAAVMYRLDSRRRRIAAAPISMSTALLASQIVASGIDYARYGIPVLGTAGPATGWLPLFLATCLVFAPNFPNCTEKILMVISLLLLGSGLLPGSGFVAIFATTQYFLFIAVAVGLAIDFKEHGNLFAPQTAQK